MYSKFVYITVQLDAYNNFECSRATVSTFNLKGLTYKINSHAFQYFRNATANWIVYTKSESRMVQSLYAFVLPFLYLRL